MTCMGIGAGNGTELYVREVYLLSANIFNLLTTWDKKRERISGIGKTTAGLGVWVKAGRVFCQIRGMWTLWAGGEEVLPSGSLVNSSASLLWRAKSNRSKIPFRTVLIPWQHCHLLCSVQSLSRVRLFGTPWTAACQASLSITNSRSLLKLMSIASVMPSNHFILCRPLLLPLVFPSIRVFSNECVLRIRWSKYWSFSFSISPSNEYSGLISFRMDWLDPLTVQRTLKSLLQYHNSKASILQCSAFFIVQLSHIHT